jgi:uncharacterized lipoprotein YajG
MRYLFILAALAALAGCSTSNEIAHTSKSDPLWQLNDGKWTFHENELVRSAQATP